MNDQYKQDVVGSASTNEPKNEVTESGSSKTTLVLKLLRRLTWRAHWWFPNLIPPSQGVRAYEQEHDKKENEHTRVPTDQKLRVRMIWGIELYSPTEIDSLYAGLRRLGWRSAGSWSDGDSALNWVRQQRSLELGGWLNIGYVVRHGQRGGSLMVSNFATLPSGVDSLRVRIFQLSPSLTGVLVGFQLEESMARCYEDELNQDRVTFRKRTHRPGAVSIISPRSQKERAVGAVRVGLRCMAGDWFRQYLPGYFCGLENFTAFPTMELLTVQNGSILKEPATVEALHSWRRLLVNAAPYYTWTYEESTGLQLTMDRYNDDNDGLHIVAALDVATFAEVALKFGSENSPHTYIYACNELVGPEIFTTI